MKNTLILSSIGIVSLLASCGAEEQKELNIAVTPLEGDVVDAQLKDELNEDLRLHIEESIGMPVNFYESTEYAVGITALAQGNLDVLLVSPMSYYQASLQADIEPLVTYSMAPDAKEYKSVFITSAENEDINTLEDLEGKTFAFVDQASSSGYLYPKYKLVSDLGLDSDNLENAGYFFESVAFSGGHPNTVVSVLNGAVDAGCVAYQMLDYIPMMVDGATIEDIKIIDETSVIPNPLFVVRSELGEELIGDLREAYLTYDNSDYFEMNFGSPDIKFIESDESALEEAENIVTTLGVEAE